MTPSLLDDVRAVFDDFQIATSKQHELRLRWQGILQLYGKSFEPDTQRLSSLVLDAQEECRSVVETILKNWCTQLGQHIQETRGYTPSEQYGIPKTEIFAALLVDHGLYNPDMLSSASPTIPLSTSIAP